MVRKEPVIKTDENECEYEYECGRWKLWASSRGCWGSLIWRLEELMQLEEFEVFRVGRGVEGYSNSIIIMSKMRW